MGTKAQTVRQLYQAFGDNAIEKARACFTDDARWHFPGSSVLAGTHVGFDAIVRDFLGRLAEMSGGTLKVELIDVCEGDGHVVAVQHATAQRPGHTLDVTACQLMRFENGRIADVRGHYSDQESLDAYWQEPAAQAK